MCTKSKFFTTNVEPRAKRMNVGTLEILIAKTSIGKLVPSNVTIKSAINNGGKASSMSTIHPTARSNRPMISPASMPMGTPTNIAKTTDNTPTISAGRAP